MLARPDETVDIQMIEWQTYQVLTSDSIFDISNDSVTNFVQLTSVALCILHASIHPHLNTGSVGGPEESYLVCSLAGRSRNLFGGQSMLPNRKLRVYGKPESRLQSPGIMGEAEPEKNK